MTVHVFDQKTEHYGPDGPCLLCGAAWVTVKNPDGWLYRRHMAEPGRLNGYAWCAPDHPLVLILAIHGS